MYGVCVYWDGTRIGSGPIQALVPVPGGWAFPGADFLPFLGEGWHKPVGRQEDVPRLDSHNAVLVYVSETPLACLAYALGFVSGYETGTRLPFHFLARKVGPSLN